ncbi:dipeptidase PepV [Fictibacillus sp. WQ 8-8]|uniref:dipeptidase PepV n=1 Tax=Fictibacillus sp. WQ 8-8 TaxID=2938788 RepID=UPI00210E7F95|nr:dipeptidase PepV [Fictibacillus sp. WQ 8-8]MCQ6266635.1 dipeptidase PepV [Fictibacillus sp. WQ 8-8]
MKNVNWKEEIEKRKENLLKDTQGLLQIRSVLDEDKATDKAPFGPGIEMALDYMLELGNAQGMQTKNVDGFAGHIEIGEGQELIGILGHLDVVPDGDGWTVDPFGGEIKDGKIFARGAIDDKGPTMAAFYGMKMIKELGLPLSKRVRLILGTDEESLWRCVDHYFKHEEMPSSGFAPDADFPIIHAEKGMLNIDLKQGAAADNRQHPNVLESFSSGRRLNMVPDQAEAVISGSEELEESFQQFLKSRNLTGSSSKNDVGLTLTLIGKSAHGSTPEFGVNAGVLLASFLSGADLDEQGKAYIGFVKDHLGSISGEELGIKAEDDVSGILTLNPGMFDYSREAGGTIGLNIRYPVKHSGETVLNTLQKLVDVKGFSLEVTKHTKPHFVDENHELVQTLKKVYEEQTGQPGNPIAIGGGTYARSLEAGVAFGALFPGREDVAHQKDEYMFLDDLFSAAAIYAQAIYELAR